MGYSVKDLVSRSVEWTATTLKSDDDHPKMPKLSAWAVFLVLVTVFGFMILFAAIQYSIGAVVGTLTIIESPQPDAYVAVDSLPPADGRDDGTPKPTSDEAAADPEVLLLKNSAITTSIRRTINFLRSRYGYLSSFRGVSLFVCLTFARMFIIQFFGIPSFMNNWAGFAVASVLADMILARWHMTWIHIVISEPSTKRWWRRAPPFSTWTKIAPAMAVYSLATQFAKILPVAAGMSFGVFKRMKHPEFDPHNGEVKAAFGQSLFIFFLIIALAVLVQLPASVILIRVAASMLPEENETVVPFDRSFGGKVTPTIIGGQGKVGIVEAWTSFDWAARTRVLKLAVKIVAIMMALWVFFALVLVGEAHLVIGSENIKKMLQAVSDYLNQK